MGMTKISKNNCTPLIKNNNNLIKLHNMTDQDRLKHIYQSLGDTYKDISDITGHTERSVYEMLRKSKEVPRWTKYLISVHERLFNKPKEKVTSTILDKVRNKKFWSKEDKRQVIKLIDALMDDLETTHKRIAYLQSLKEPEFRLHRDSIARNSL